MKADFHRKLVEESTDVTTIIDPEGTISYVSPSVTHVLGYEQEELEGEVGYEYQHPDDRETVADAIERLQNDSDGQQTIETRFRHADGSWCWIEATLQNRLSDEDIGGILVNSRDISERKQRDREFRELAAEYKTLLDTVEDGIFFLSVESPDSGHEFRFERVSHAYEEQTGISTAEVRGKKPSEVFGEDVGLELEMNYERCVRAGHPISYQEKVPVEAGGLYWQTNLAPVMSRGEVTRVIGITRNVTERVRRERQLRSQKEQLDEFASVVSHDLRNPLNVAQARAELLTEECESEHLAPLVEATDRMEEIVTDTLTLARRGQVTAQLEEVRLTDVIGKCWKNVSTDRASIEVVEDMTIKADRSRLRHIFENLFRNAVEHGGPEVTVRVGRIGEHGIYVEDTGPGIPETDRDTVFEPGHSSSTGTGFGLTIIKRIAEAHGWEIKITDGDEGGARFEFTGVETRVH